MTTTTVMTTTTSAPASARSILTEQAAAAWIDYAERENRIKPKSRETYERAIRQFMRYCADNGVDQPKKTDVQAFVLHLIDQGRSDSTVNLYICAIRLFFRWACDMGIYPDAIADRIKGVRSEYADGHKRDALTSTQAHDLLAQIDRSTLKGARDYAMLLTMTACGLRDIEVTRADKGDLRRSGDGFVLYVQGKGKTTKSDFVKVPPQAERAIREYHARRAAEEGRPLAADAPLFAGAGNKNNGGRLTTRSVSGTAKQHLRGIGLDDPRLTAHSLRHTAVTLALIGNGGDIRAAQQFARQSKAATTELYAHDLDRAANTCAQLVADMIAG